MKRTTTKQTASDLKKRLQGHGFSPGERQTLLELISEPIAYMPDESFDEPVKMATLMKKEFRFAAGERLTVEGEAELFLQLNYSRHKLCAVRRTLLGRRRWSRQLLTQLLYWNRRQLLARGQIVSANMGLVLAMAKRSGYAGVEFNDLISEGSFALLRATDKFDLSRGYRFSTYACRAIFQALARAAKRVYRHNRLFPTTFNADFENGDVLADRRVEDKDDWIDELRLIVKDNLADLSAIEQSVVKLRFPLTNGSSKQLTLKQVGAKLGLTKERIRQIQNKALTKLRTAAEDRIVAI